MNMYEGYHFVGMHFFWWFLWISILIWIFAVPYNIPGQRYKRDSPLEILKKRLASGEINTTEYQEMKSVLDIV